MTCKHPSLARQLAAWLVALLATASHAQPPPPALPDPAATDPARLGWMQGTPPSPDKTIRWADGSFYKFPQLRWSFSNMSQLMPTRSVWRGDGPVRRLEGDEDRRLEQLQLRPTGAAQDLSLAQALQATHTDAIVVLHKGRVVYERYFGVTTPQTRHIAWSVTKSVFGTLAATLVAEGRLDPKAKVTQYIPELQDSGYADASVQDVLDMVSGIRFSEKYADPKAEIWDYVRAGSLFPAPPGYSGPRSFYDYARTVQKAGAPGSTFAYQTVNSDIAGWLIRRVTGQGVSEVLSERIWRKLGAERDALMVVDSAGNEFAGGGLNMTARDMARFGEMIRLDGRYNGQAIVPKAAIDDIRKGGNREVFARAGYDTLPGWSYRNMWWVSHNANGAFAARGVHGQAIYIDPKAEMVIARFGSDPAASSVAHDPVLQPMYRALADALVR